MSSCLAKKMEGRMSGSGTPDLYGAPRRWVRWAVWMTLGAVIGFLVGAFSIEFAWTEGHAAESARVEVFGEVLHRETGPHGTADRVFWTWGAGAAALFVLLGAGVGAAVVLAINRLTERKGKGV
jgi:hypothetical protein